MITYGFTVRWRNKQGFMESLSVSDCTNKDQVKYRAFALAQDSGWTPPKWWKPSTWNNTPLPKEWK